MSNVKEVWDKAFENSEYLFAANRSLPMKSKNNVICNYYSFNIVFFFLGDTSLTHCIVVAIIGHYSGEGTVSEDHFHFETSDARQNCINIDKPIDLMYYIVSHFSPFNGTVLDLTEQNGKLFMLSGLYTESSPIVVLN